MKTVRIFSVLLVILMVAYASCDSDESSTDSEGKGEDDDDLADDDVTNDDDLVDDDDAPSYDVTFYVLADTHCNSTPDDDQFAGAAAVNAIAVSGQWPETIDGEPTGFIGGEIGPPEGVVFVGDITGSGDVSSGKNEIKTFQRFYQSGYAAESIKFPAYVGLGNHDVDRDDIFAETYRQRIWEYVENRHKGAQAPVPVSNFHNESRNYSWDWGGVHLVQNHKCATDTQYGQISALDWLENDLAQNAADGRPVLIFQHFGFDLFGQQERWWTSDDREALASVLKPYNVVALFAGHTHFAKTYKWDGWLDVIQVNNIKAEVGEGNEDGNGSFAVVRITDTRLEAMTCRWLDHQGNVEFIAPFTVLEFE